VSLAKTQFRVDSPTTPRSLRLYFAPKHLLRDRDCIYGLEFHGVELAAIQGLDRKLEEKEARIQKQETENHSQAEEIRDLQQRLVALERAILKPRTN
jgi:DNA-binding transcriptional MerR regulator